MASTPLIKCENMEGEQVAIAADMIVGITAKGNELTLIECLGGVSYKVKGTASGFVNHWEILKRENSYAAALEDWVRDNEGAKKS